MYCGSTGLANWLTAYIITCAGSNLGGQWAYVLVCGKLSDPTAVNSEKKSKNFSASSFFAAKIILGKGLFYEMLLYVTNKKKQE